MNKEEILKRIGEEWLTLIMRGDTVEETRDALEACVAGGSRMIEVPFTTPNAERAIADLAGRHGAHIILAAGTVRTPEQAQQAIDNGADVIVSPDFYPPVVETALKNGVVSVPGCLTPTEVTAALRLGADIIKIFPCYLGGPDYIRYLSGPFPGIRTLPGGSVTLENMKSYYDAGAFAAVVGVTTEMQLLDAVKERRYDEVTRTTKVWMAQVAAIRGRKEGSR